MTQSTYREAVVLLVEDNPADQKLTVRAFNRGRVKTNLQIVNDGQEAIDYLQNKGAFFDKGKSPRPDLILLDINMPKIDGKQVLKAIREDQSIKTIPVIMLTTSDQEKDVIESYQLGVNAYINKPVGITDFVNIIEQLEEFWLKLTILPPRQA